MAPKKHANTLAIYGVLSRLESILLRISVNVHKIRVCSWLWPNSGLSLCNLFFSSLVSPDSHIEFNSK